MTLQLWHALGLQDGASPLMQMMVSFHDHAMVVLILIVSFVGFIMGSLFFNSYTHRFLLEDQHVEIIWTVIPAVILVFIALPSLRLLYLLDEVYDPSVTLKVIGHQWFWSYEYCDVVDFEYSSYMLPTNNIPDNGFRLLEVDNRVVLPLDVPVRMMVSAADVIHSWTVPAFGVKADAIPGRLNQIGLELDRPGVFYGQCSEICGANHSFMPIVVEGINIESFLEWLFAGYELELHEYEDSDEYFKDES